MGDYHRARWRALQQLHSGGEVLAADLGGKDALYGWDNTEETSGYVSFSEKPVDQVDFFQRMRRFVGVLRKRNIGLVCIPGYGRPEYVAMLLVSRLMGRRVLMFAESWYPGIFLLDWCKGWFLRPLVDKFLVSGVKARDHFHNRLGIPSSRIVMGYSVVDNSHFYNVLPYHSSTPVLLCMARFATEKNLSVLISAFDCSLLPSNGWVLKLVGGGPLKDQLQGMVRNASVVLADWVSYDQLPGLYHSAACFVLPSVFEPWGLVVNEAMAAGLPIIVSKQCGCAPDLCSSRNGWTFDAQDPDELMSVLNVLATTSREKLARMGGYSKQQIAAFTPETWADAVLHSLDDEYFLRNR